MGEERTIHGGVFGHGSLEGGVGASSDIGAGFYAGSGKDGETTVASNDAHTGQVCLRVAISPSSSARRHNVRGDIKVR